MQIHKIKIIFFSALSEVLRFYLIKPKVLGKDLHYLHYHLQHILHKGRLIILFISIMRNTYETKVVINIGVRSYLTVTSLVILQRQIEGVTRTDACNSCFCLCGWEEPPLSSPSHERLPLSFV